MPSSTSGSFYDFKPLDKTGETYDLAQTKGKVVLVVNTASKCGFTPQFAGLEKLYKDVTAKHPDDFLILGFPCNQFGGQDPGSNDQIQEFCQVNYGVTFPVLAKIDVNGDKAAPLYTWMKSQHPGILGLKRIKWNFEKFLIGRDGQVKGRWGSITKPESLKSHIDAELNKPAPGTSVPPAATTETAAAVTATSEAATAPADAPVAPVAPADTPADAPAPAAASESPKADAPKE